MFQEKEKEVTKLCHKMLAFIYLPLLLRFSVGLL